MRGYPLFLNVKGVSCRVFGGGEVAARKVKTLLDRGAHVTCVSRDFSEPLKQWARRGRLRLEKMQKQKGRVPFLGTVPKKGTGQLRLRRMRGGRIDLDGARLVVVATSDRDFNARVAALCRRKKIFVNVADDPKLCDFYAPAIVEKGPLQIAISTGGTSPLFARRLREALEKVIPGSVGKVLEKAGNLRQKRLLAKKSMGHCEAAVKVRLKHWLRQCHGWQSPIRDCFAPKNGARNDGGLQ